MKTGEIYSKFQTRPRRSCLGNRGQFFYRNPRSGKRSCGGIEGRYILTQEKEEFSMLE
jgi:hypothetical protein